MNVRAMFTLATQYHRIVRQGYGHLTKNRFVANEMALTTRSVSVISTVGSGAQKISTHAAMSLHATKNRLVPRVRSGSHYSTM